EGGDALRVEALELGEAGVVDHRPGLDPQPAEAEEDGQPQPRHGGDGHEDDLVPADVDAGEAEGAVGEDRRHGPGGGAVDPDGDALEGDQQTERDHDVGGGRGALQAPEQDPVDDDADRRPDAEDGDGQGRGGREPGVDPQRVEDEGGDHAD